MDEPRKQAPMLPPITNARLLESSTVTLMNNYHHVIVIPTPAGNTRLTYGSKISMPTEFTKNPRIAIFIKKGILKIMPN